VFNLDPAKILVIGMLALVLLGPDRLPKVARQLGGAWRELTRLRDQVTDEVRAAFPVEDLPRIPSPSRSISSAVSSVTRPLVASRTADGDGDVEEDPAEVSMRAEVTMNATVFANNTAATRRAPAVVVHGALGDFAFLPDDPSMN
jgi:Sec-independent protein translocase protein TatA